MQRKNRQKSVYYSTVQFDTATRFKCFKTISDDICFVIVFTFPPRPLNHFFFVFHNNLMKDEHTTTSNDFVCFVFLLVFFSHVLRQCSR